MAMSLRELLSSSAEHLPKNTDYNLSVQYPLRVHQYTKYVYFEGKTERDMGRNYTQHKWKARDTAKIREIEEWIPRHADGDEVQGLQ